VLQRTLSATLELRHMPSPDADGTNIADGSVIRYNT
jgi:hypothetical protein